MLGYSMRDIYVSHGHLRVERSLILYISKKKLNEPHAVSRTQQGRQREPSVKTLRSPLSAEFWRHCVLSGRTQRRALPRHQSEEMEI